MAADPQSSEPRDGETPEPSDEKMYTTEPVETDEGTVVIQQQNVGRENMRGDGEWPDPETPPERPAAGAS
jgi:hypothetical protein